MLGSLRIGKLFGIEISIHVSWFIIVVLLTWSLATGWFPATATGWPTLTYWVVALLATLLLFVSVLLHELAHSLVARARGLPVKNITLFIFGGVSNIEQEPKTPGVEFQMAFVGPLISLLLGGLSYLLLLATRGEVSALSVILEYLAVTNILLGLFNLVPAFPLDGGRVLRSIIWKINGNLLAATRAATLIGQGIAYLLILAGFWLLLGGNILNGIWFGLVGWFLLNGAQSANSQIVLETVLKGVKVSEVMNSNPATAPANISLQMLVDDFLLPNGWRHTFVTQGEYLAGLITLSDIRHVPRDEWKQTPVGFTMIPSERLLTVSPQQSLNEALPLMVARNVNQVPVVVDSRLVGVLSREDIMRFLEIRRSLGLDMVESKSQGA
jgi:Zn-dependent protease